MPKKPRNLADFPPIFFTRAAVSDCTKTLPSTCMMKLLSRNRKLAIIRSTSVLISIFSCRLPMQFFMQKTWVADSVRRKYATSRRRSCKILLFLHANCRLSLIWKQFHPSRQISPARVIVSLDLNISSSLSGATAIIWLLLLPRKPPPKRRTTLSRALCESERPFQHLVSSHSSSHDLAGIPAALRRPQLPCPSCRTSWPRRGCQLSKLRSLLLRPTVLVEEEVTGTGRSQTLGPTTAISPKMVWKTEKGENIK